MLNNQFIKILRQNKGRKAENTNPLLWNIQSAKYFKKEQVVPANAQIMGKKLLAKLATKEQKANCFLSLFICLLAAKLVNTLKLPTTQKIN